MPKDYSRGKSAAYTKWDVDSENVDMDVEKDENNGNAAPHEEDSNIRVITNKKLGCLSGRKGSVIRVLIVLVIFLSGLTIGYLFRRSVHDYVIEKEETSCPVPTFYGYEKHNGAFLRKNIDAQNIMKDIKELSSIKKKVMVGSEAHYRRSSAIRMALLSYGMESVVLDKYTVLLSYPHPDLNNEVRLIGASRKPVFTAESPRVPIKETHEAFRKLWPYTAYSSNGTVEASYIYAHYGRKEDYHTLEQLGIGVKDRILIMRIGKTHVANKVALAEMHGAAAILLYPDPQDYRSRDANVYLNHAVPLPSDAVVLASAKLFPGDPETPNTASTNDTYRLPRSQLPIPKIPVQPISPSDAFHILNHLGGISAPGEWTGGLNNLDYRLGPEINPNVTKSEEIKLQLKSYNVLERRDIYNVIASIRGHIEPGRYVVIGNQLGSFTSTGTDSGPSDSIFMEIVQGFTKLLKTGWKPNRSLILAAFDGQEFGNIGMEEWLQSHREEVIQRTVAYLGVGRITGSHSLAVQATPLLRQAVKLAAEDMPVDADHPGLTMYDVWKVRRPQTVNSAKSEAKIDPPGIVDDFIDPMWIHGIATAYFHYVGKSSDHYPYYHTKRKSFNVGQMAHEPMVMQNLAGIISMTAVRLTDSLQLPIIVSDYPKQITADLDEFMKRFGDILQAHDITSSNLVESLNHFTDASRDFDNNYSSYDDVNLFLEVRQYNDRLMELEKAFLAETRYEINDKVSRAWSQFKNVLYGPDPDNVADTSIFPRLHAAINQATVNNTTLNWQLVKEEMSIICQGLHNAVGLLTNSILHSTSLLPHSHH